MRRGIAPVVFLGALVLALTGAAARPSSSAIGLALGATPAATPEPTPPTELELCAADIEEKYLDRMEARPDAGPAAKTRPRDVTGMQDLYLVELTIPRGICVPYNAVGNKKAGAIVIIVEQGVIELTAQPYGDEPAADVYWGHSWSESGTKLNFGDDVVDVVTLYPGDWVTMSDQVWFTYTSVGDEDAVITKAVWADLGDDIGSSGGTRK